MLCCVTCNNPKNNQPFWEFLDKKNYELFNKSTTICLFEDEKLIETINMGIGSGLLIVFYCYY